MKKEKYSLGEIFTITAHMFRPGGLTRDDAIKLIRKNQLKVLDFLLDNNWPRLDKDNLLDLAGIDLALLNKNMRGIRHLSYVNFQGADLRGVDFTDTYLLGCDFTGADMRGCNLTEATMAFTILDHADLRNSVMERTMFFNADMRYVILDQADFSSTTLEEAFFDHDEFTKFKDACEVGSSRLVMLHDRHYPLFLLETPKHFDGEYARTKLVSGDEIFSDHRLRTGQMNIPLEDILAGLNLAVEKGWPGAKESLDGIYNSSYSDIRVQLENTLKAHPHVRRPG